MTIIRAMEKNLGAIQEGWKSDVFTGLSIVKFGSSETPLTFLMSLGLSHKNFSAHGTKKRLRFEYFMEFSDSESEVHAAALLLEISDKTVSRDKLPRPGDTIPLPNGVWVKDNISSLYLTSPYLRSAAFIEDMDSNGVAVIWLVPITSIEERFLERHGRAALEDLWLKEKTNLYDPYRRMNLALV